MDETAAAIARALGYTFQTPHLVHQALTHRSYSNEREQQHNERLEFLGDAVVNLIVSYQLMESLPDAREGELTKLRAMVVSETSLALCAAELRIGELLQLGKGEEQSGGRHKASILADAFEALMGAVFVDGGFDAATHTVRRLLGPLIGAAQEGELDRDHKTRLQEVAQREWHVMPTYGLIEEQGPDHAKVFRVAVYFGEREIAQGEGPSKKVAEQQAARLALKLLR